MNATTLYDGIRLTFIESKNTFLNHSPKKSTAQKRTSRIRKSEVNSQNQRRFDIEFWKNTIAKMKIFFKSFSHGILQNQVRGTKATMNRKKVYSRQPNNCHFSSFFFTFHQQLAESKKKSSLEYFNHQHLVFGRENITKD